MGRRPTSTSSWRSASAPPPPPSGAQTATAVVAAAGSGERLGAGGPKALVEVAGRPMLAWCVEALMRAEAVGPIVIAAPPGREGLVREAALAAASAPNGDFSTVAVEKPTLGVVAGGETRAESVRAALERVETDLVVIHDAARPVVTASLVDSVVQRLVDRPDAAGVIAAAPLADTVKRVRLEGGEPPVVERTESREDLWAAQTPQAFRADALRHAYDASRDSVVATDEATLIEAAGGTVLIEPAPRWNLKVTTPEDLRVAELLLGD